MVEAGGCRPLRRLGVSWLVVIGWLIALPADSGAAETEVDLELVLAVDVSGSMDVVEQAAQRNGYVAAFRHPEVVRAISQGIIGRIAVTYAEWAGSGLQAVVVPWTLIDGVETAAGFADHLEAAPFNDFRGTSISGGIDHAASLFAQSGFAGLRQVIDISGDGPNNRGRPVVEARDDAVARGITINGLPVVLGRPGGRFNISSLDIYYEDCVIGGPGAFLIAVDAVGRLAEAIRRKLVLEIADAPAQLMQATFHAPAPRIDCLIGERLRRQWYDDW